MTGKLKFRLANAALGAIVTHALVNKEGTYIVAAESGTSASRTDGRTDGETECGRTKYSLEVASRLIMIQPTRGVQRISNKCGANEIYVGLKIGCGAKDFGCGVNRR